MVFLIFILTLHVWSYEVTTVTNNGLINLLKFLIVVGLQMDQRQLTITIRRFFEASYVNYAYICSIAIAIILA